MKGIKNHGERAVTDIYREYTQLEDMKVLGELNRDSLTISHKKGALRSITSIKENREEN